MLDHHLQRSIVYRLAFAVSLRFSDLKPGIVDSKLFTYHLKKTITAGYVAKQSDGQYTLTPEGRRLGIRVLDNQQMLLDRADSVLFLVIRRKADDSWLLYKRNTHPLIDRVGFMHCTPSPFENTSDTAAKACQAKTGLICDFYALGSGYFRVYEKGELESFTHFTLLVSNDAQGELREDDEYAEYSWYHEPNFSDQRMLPNMAILTSLYFDNRLFFIEKTLET